MKDLTESIAVVYFGTYESAAEVISFICDALKDTPMPPSRLQLVAAGLCGTFSDPEGSALDYSTVTEVPVDDLRKSDYKVSSEGTYDEDDDVSNFTVNSSVQVSSSDYSHRVTGQLKENFSSVSTPSLVPSSTKRQCVENTTKGRYKDSKGKSQSIGKADDGDDGDFSVDECDDCEDDDDDYKKYVDFSGTS